MSMPVEGAAQSGGTGAQSGSQTDGNTAGQTGAAEGSAQSGAATAEKTYTQADFDAMRNQLSAADRKREAAENEAKALRDANLSEEEKRKQALEQAQKDLAAKDEAIKKLQLQNAFLNDNTYEWHNPKAALQLADLGNVTVDGDKVNGLKEALKAVADAHPYMIKPKAEGQTGTEATAQGATGVTGQGGSASSQGTNTKASLEKRFPGLRGRVS